MLNNIKVEKTKLLDTLRANRTKHADEYVEARRGFLMELKRELEAKLEALDGGKRIELSFDNEAPRDMTKDYDDAISMLEWDTQDAVELDHRQFQQYVLDNWGWKDQWVTSNTHYIGASRAVQ